MTYWDSYFDDPLDSADIKYGYIKKQTYVSFGAFFVETLESFTPEFKEMAR